MIEKLIVKVAKKLVFRYLPKLRSLVISQLNQSQVRYGLIVALIKAVNRNRNYGLTTSMEYKMAADIYDLLFDTRKFVKKFKGVLDTQFASEVLTLVLGRQISLGGENGVSTERKPDNPRKGRKSGSAS